AELESRVFDFVLDLREPGEEIQALSGHPEVTELELLQAIFGRLEVFLVRLCLLVDELHRAAGIEPLVAKARLDEDRKDRLDDVSRLFRTGVAIRDHIN